MSASVFAFLAQVKERGAQLPEPLAAALLLAAVRLSDKSGQAIRPDLLVVDDDGGLTLRKGSSKDPSGPYSAPELATEKISPRDPRVLVYAAGALGYELSTLGTPHPGATAEGLLGPVIQKALSAERKERYKNLDEMAHAIQELQKRPTNDEERLILTAVVQSTAAPKTVAKVSTRKVQAFYALDPKDAPDSEDDEPDAYPKRGGAVHGWDPQDRSPRVVFAKDPAAPAQVKSAAKVVEVAPPAKAKPDPQPPPEASRGPDAPEPAAAVEAPRPDEALDRVREIAAEMQADRRSRGEEFALLDSRIDAVARLGERIEALEKRPISAPQRLDRQKTARDLLEDRRFADAERVLRAGNEDDAATHLLLAMALAGQWDSDGRRGPQIEAELRRASEIDPNWAQPKALLGAWLARHGRRAEGLPLLHAALVIDPENPIALASLESKKPRTNVWSAAAGGMFAGAVAALAVALPLRGPAPAAAPALTQVAVAPQPGPEPLPVAAATPLPLPLPPPPAKEREKKPEPVAAAARPEKASRPRKVARAQGNRPEAVAEAAKGEKALRAFDTAAALAAFQAALRLDPALASAHRGLGMVHVLQGKDAEAKAEYRKYLELQPDAPDREQIQRLISR